MSKSLPRPSSRKTDRTAAVTLEVPTGVADDIEKALRGYAEEAELDTSLVVDHSGFLVAGISSLPDVDVDSIGTLVAKASEAAENLVISLGAYGRFESLHLGEDRLFYFKEIGARFILVAVSDSNVPAGILRDQATLIEPALLKLLEKVKAVPMSLTRKKAEEKPREPESIPEPPKSLRQPDPVARPVVSIAPVSAPSGENLQLKPQARSVGGAVPSPQAFEQPGRTNPVVPPKKDPLPAAIFEMDNVTSPLRHTPSAPAASVASKKVEPHAVVENSPFEMDDDDDDHINFQPVRPKTTPVHLSVPAARQREAAARKESQNDDDHQSGPRYSFELG
jgi:predicted regulator of Ras-like GTPase activity (Roadblock/LC7/MglB family)